MTDDPPGPGLHHCPTCDVVFVAGPPPSASKTMPCTWPNCRKHIFYPTHDPRAQFGIVTERGAT